MTDGVTVTAGSGTTIATDQAGGEHYQKVKLVDGTADSTAVIAGDATNGLDVDVTRVGGTVTVDGSGVTQPVSGTVTANLGTIGGTATAANQTSGGQKTQIVGTTGQVAEVSANALDVRVVSGSAAGTEYTEGDTDASFSGPVVQAEGPSNTATPLQVDASKHLQVDIAASSATVTVDGSGVTQPVSIASSVAVTGSVTANAGTNLNTSALALESGGNLATIAGDTTAIQTSVELIDDIVYTDGVGTVTKGVAILGQDGTNPQAIKTDTSGELQIDVVSSALPTGAATEASLVAIDTSTASMASDVQSLASIVKVDDQPFTPANSSVSMMGAEFDDTLPDSVDEGDAGSVRMSARRELYTQIRDAAGNERGLSVDVNGAIGVTNAGITTIAGAVAGTEMQVDVLTMPTVAVTQSGTWDEVGINDSGNNISIDWAGTVPPIGAGTEAAALRVTVATDSTGVLSVDDNGGALTVDGTVAVTGVSTLAEQQTQTTALQLIDDTVFTDDTSTHSTGSTKGIGVMATATPTDASVNANDIGMVAMTTDRKLHVAVMDALPAGTAAIGKLAANSGVDIGDVDVASIAAGDNNIGNVDIVSGTITTVSALGVGTTGPQKAEDVAHSTGDMGIPAWGVRQDTPNATAAASNDYHYLATDMVGGLRTALYETDFAVLGTNHVKKYYTSAGAVTDGIVWSPAAGKRWYVTDIFIQVSAAATVTLEDDLAAGDSALWKAELAANSGWSHSFSTPLFSGEDAADLLITTSAGNVYVTATGYEI